MWFNMTRPRDRREILMRVIDLCNSVIEGEVDPFAVNVVELFEKLRSVFPELETDEELNLDLEAVLGLTGVVLKQDEWVKYRSSLLFFDPLLVLLKIERLSSRDLADALLKSWKPIVSIELLTADFLTKAMEYWRNLPDLEERRARLPAGVAELGSLSFDDLVSMGFASEEEFMEALEALNAKVRTLAKEGGKAPYWEVVAAPTFEETVRNAQLISFLCTYGYATIVKNPITEEMWIVPTEGEGGPRSSFVISISREEWEKHAVGS